VRDFQVFITDDRYSVPTLSIVQMASAAEAGELAARLLAGSVHHLAVEVFDEGVCICRVGETRARGSTTETG